MQSKLIHDGDQKTYAIIFDAGDECVTLLKEFATLFHSRCRLMHFQPQCASGDQRDAITAQSLCLLFPHAELTAGRGSIPQSHSVLVDPWR